MRHELLMLSIYSEYISDTSMIFGAFSKNAQKKFFNGFYLTFSQMIPTRSSSKKSYILIVYPWLKYGLDQRHLRELWIHKFGFYKHRLLNHPIYRMLNLFDRRDNVVNRNAVHRSIAICVQLFQCANQFCEIVLHHIVALNRT